MVSLFQLADPSENRGNAVTVKEVLDKGAKEIRSDKSSNGLRTRTAGSRRALDGHGPGVFRAWAVCAGGRFAGSSTCGSGLLLWCPTTSRIRTLVASGSTLYLAGKYDDAATLLSRAVDLARKSSGGRRPATLYGLDWPRRRVDPAREVSASHTTLPGGARGRPQTRPPGRGSHGAHALYNGSGLLLQRRSCGGRAPMREALRVREQVLGMHHALTAQALNDLGGCSTNRGDTTKPLAPIDKRFPSIAKYMARNTRRWRLSEQHRTIRAGGWPRRRSRAAAASSRSP